MQYKRADIEGGVITDPAEINYYKQVQNNDVLNNYMLGDFNEAGNYVITKEIVNELLRLTKVMQHTYGKTIFCISAKKLKDFGVLEFAVKINREEAKPKEAIASLELLEPIDKVGGYYQNINTVLIATYTDIYNAEFLEKAYAAFNIITNIDDYKGRKKLEDSAEEILARKEYLLQLQKLAELGSEKTEKDFFNARVATLSKNSEVGKSILVRLQLETKKVSKLFLNPNSPKYYAKLNELLDKILEETKRTIDPNLKESLQNAQQIYVKDIQVSRQNALNNLLQSNILPQEVIAKQAQVQIESKSQNAKPNVENKNKFNLDDKVVVADDKSVEKVNITIKPSKDEQVKIVIKAHNPAKIVIPVDENNNEEIKVGAFGYSKTNIIAKEKEEEQKVKAPKEQAQTKEKVIEENNNKAEIEQKLKEQTQGKEIEGLMNF